MITLIEVQASNSRITSTLSSPLVAIFVGGTNGVGETTLKQFVKYAPPSSRVYNIGRSQESADRIGNECQDLNGRVKYEFIKADTSLLGNIDQVCRKVKSKERSINLLFLTMGTLDFQTETSDGFTLQTALTFYGRNRFIVNFLPQIQQATNLRRVVSVYMGTFEGQMYLDNIKGKNLYMFQQGAHNSSLVTLSHEHLVTMAPDVTFIHTFPGSVKSGIGRDASGMFKILKSVFGVFGPLLDVPNLETGERHLFMATSARYRGKQQRVNEDKNRSGGDGDGVPLLIDDGVAVQAVRGVDGQVGSGTYSLNWNGESANRRVERLMANYKEKGIVDQIWRHVEGEFERITGSTAM